MAGEDELVTRRDVRGLHLRDHVAAEVVRPKLVPVREALTPTDTPGALGLLVVVTSDWGIVITGPHLGHQLLDLGGEF